MREKKYSTLDDSEIVKFLIGKEVAELRDQNDFLKLAENSSFFVNDKSEKQNYNKKDLKPIK